MEETNKIAALEAILFTVGEAAAVAELAKKLKISLADCENLIEEYSRTLADRPESGLVLVREGDRVKLATKPVLASFISDLLKEEFRENLTPAALETLAIVAYLGPLSRAAIDQIRGVNSSFILRNLLVRGLVGRVNEERKAGGFVYRVTGDFLAHLGLVRAEDLPEFENLKKTLERFDLEVQSEGGPQPQDFVKES